MVRNTKSVIEEDGDEIGTGIKTKQFNA